MRSLLYSSTLFLLLLCCFCPKAGAQKYKFKQEGTIDLTGAEFKKKEVVTSSSFSAPASIKLSDAQKKQVKQELAARLGQAIDNMEDDATGLPGFYKQLWGENTYDDIIAEMTDLRHYLLQPNENDQINRSATYVPTRREIKTLLDADIYTMQPVDAGKAYEVSRIVFVNRLKQFILQRMQQTMQTDNIDRIQMDGSYKRAWRELENALQETVTALNKIKQEIAPCSPTRRTDEYTKLHQKLHALLGSGSANKVVQLLQKPFFQKWLWYTQGYLMMNPLVATTPDRRYPATEKMAQLSDSSKKKPLTEADENTLWATLVQTRKVQNELLVPNGTSRKKTSYYFYDGLQAYKGLNQPGFPQQWYDRNSPGIIIYNVPAKDTLALTIDSLTIKDQSTASQIVETALGSESLTSILTNTPAWLTSWGKVSGAFNGIKPITIIPNTIPEPNIDPVGKDLVDTKAEKSFFKNEMNKRNKEYFGKVFQQQAQLQEISAPVMEMQQQEYFVIIGHRKIPAIRNVDDDKNAFIAASLLHDNKDTCSNCSDMLERCLIDTFIKRDKCYTFDYDSPELNDEAQDMLKRFRCYTDSIRDCRASLVQVYNTITEHDLSLLKNYTGILQRSLPPVFTKDNPADTYFAQETMSEAPEYRTVIFTPDLPNHATELTYKITTKQKAILKDGQDPASVNMVIKEKFKYAKKHWIDFSVGLAYTTADYLEKSRDGNNITISEADRFKPIAGLHIYPLGLLKVDDRLRPSLSRLSLFGGVSLKKALDNLYTGISYDIVPGIRVIGGWHFYKDTRYSIVNNQVVDQASAFQNSGGFVSLNLEPLNFIKLIGLVK